MGRLSGNLQFWQLLLAAEIPSARADLLIQEIESKNLDPQSYLKTRAQLSDVERSRVTSSSTDLLEKAVKMGIHVVERKDLPLRCANLPLSPPAVFARGDASILHKPCVAIVGTRSATTYGKAVAQKFAESLASEGICIVSGGALGIDAAAHKGAIEANGKTVAVLACGAEHCYPAANRGLFDRIVQHGCLISQFAVGSTVAEYKFLLRNDLIASLSDAVLIIEAPSSSGALRTANTAVNLNRPVLVVPGAIDLVSFRGSHNLIRDGATLVDHPHQVLDAIGFASTKQDVLATSVMTDEQQLIFETLIEGPLLPENIVERTGLEPASVLAELTMLELDGVIIRDDGRFARKP